MGRRVLVTGLGSFWGGRIAQALERDPSVDVIIGLDRHEPAVALERTEYVRSDAGYSILDRIVAATSIDTIVHTFLVVDSSQMPARKIHEINAIGTMNLFAAASAPGSTVRRVVVKSSTLVYGATHRDPNWFAEDTPRTGRPRTLVERSLIEVEGYVRDYGIDNPDVTVALLRYSNVLGADIRTPIARLLELPFVPQIGGFDPRMQFVHEDDVVRSILFVLDHDIAGVFNVAGDGLISWSEAAAIVGKPLLPLPPIGTQVLAPPARRLGIDLTPDLLALLRFGRGVDNRRLKAEGFGYTHTSAGTVDSFARGLRLRRAVGATAPAYAYEADVETFFRHSPSVARD
ncbi:MAG: NAD-dependent epimerase/dehydratase family protein [Acidimicrobiales bacterium]